MLLVRLLEDTLCVFIYHCVLADWRFSDSVWLLCGVTVHYVLLPWPKGSIPERRSILHEPAPLRIRGLKRETATAKRKEMEERYKKWLRGMKKKQSEKEGEKKYNELGKIRTLMR